MPMGLAAALLCGSLPDQAETHTANGYSGNSNVQPDSLAPKSSSRLLRRLWQHEGSFLSRATRTGRSEIMKKATCVTTRWSLCPAGVGRVSQVWCASLRFLLCGLWLCGGLLCAASPAQAAVKAGNILVADQNGGTGSHGALFVVNPKTGQRTILSDLGNPMQGRLGISLECCSRAGRANFRHRFFSRPL